MPFQKISMLIWLYLTHSHHPILFASSNCRLPAVRPLSKFTFLAFKMIFSASFWSCVRACTLPITDPIAYFVRSITFLWPIWELLAILLLLIHYKFANKFWPKGVCSKTAQHEFHVHLGKATDFKQINAQYAFETDLQVPCFTLLLGLPRVLQHLNRT